MKSGFYITYSIYLKHFHIVGQKIQLKFKGCHDYYFNKRISKSEYSCHL